MNNPITPTPFIPVFNGQYINTTPVDMSRWTTVPISCKSKKFEDERQEHQRLRFRKTDFQKLKSDAKERLEDDLRKRALYRQHKRSSWATKLEYYVEPIAKPELRIYMIKDVMGLESPEERSRALKKVERLIRNYFLRAFKSAQREWLKQQDHKVVEVHFERIEVEVSAVEGEVVPFFLAGRPIDKEDTCPICRDTFEEGVITWCAKRCGMNFHQECIYTWLDHQCILDLSMGGPQTCPYCSRAWEDGAWRLFLHERKNRPWSKTWAERLLEDRWSRFDHSFRRQSNC